MRQSYRVIPIYTADVSGVCSALYELGGMVVMHDPSGCNSTYNTHDEIRWYEQDSLIFISGLSEMDAIFGNDEKFLNDIKEAAEEFHPKFIALAGSPIPYMNGTDFPALAQILEEETGIPSFAVPTNGMHDYVYGAGIALEEIAKRFVTDVNAEAIKKVKKNTKAIKKFSKEDQLEATTKEITEEANVEQKLNFRAYKEDGERTMNLLGVTPLDFGPIESVQEMKENLKEYGWKICSTWAMEDSLENLACAGDASVNLVVSSVGLRAAKVLYEKCGTPYVIGTPIWEYAQSINSALEFAIKEGKAGLISYLKDWRAIQLDKDTKREWNGNGVKNIAEDSRNARVECDAVKQKFDIKNGAERSETVETVTIIGEPVKSCSLAAMIEENYGKNTRVFCPLQETEGLLRPQDRMVKGEEEMEEALKDAEIIVADPLYRPICPKEAKFYELPHVAFSGRIFLKRFAKKMNI